MMAEDPTISHSHDGHFVAFKEYTENIRQYIQTGHYPSSVNANTKRAIRKATSMGQYSMEGKLDKEKGLVKVDVIPKVMSDITETCNSVLNKVDVNLSVCGYEKFC